MRTDQATGLLILAVAELSRLGYSQSAICRQVLSADWTEMQRVLDDGTPLAVHAAGCLAEVERQARQGIR